MDQRFPELRPGERVFDSYDRLHQTEVEKGSRKIARLAFGDRIELLAQQAQNIPDVQKAIKHRIGLDQPALQPIDIGSALARRRAISAALCAIAVDKPVYQKLTLDRCNRAGRKPTCGVNGGGHISTRMRRVRFSYKA